MIFDPSQSKMRTLVQVLHERAAAQADSRVFTFVRDDESLLEITYGELHKAALSIAARLIPLARRGERAVLLYAPGIDYIAAFLGCMLACVVPVPCYPPTNKRNSGRIESIVRDCGASIVLTSRGMAAKFRPWIECPQWLEAGWDDDESGIVEVEALGPAGLLVAQPEDLAFLQYTSGSTGTPKGVRITHRNLIANSQHIRRAFQLTPDSVGATWLPPYHDMGLIGGLLQVVYSGIRTVVLSPTLFLQQPIRWLRAISTHRATHSGAPNFAFDLCAQRVTEAQKADLDLSSWSLAFCGAEPLRAQTLERFHEAFKSCGFRREALFPCYGLAEATLLVTASRSHTGPVLHPQQR